MACKLLVLVCTMVVLTGCGVEDPSSGGYTGAHGVGVLVDNPDESPNVENWPMCSDGARHPDCRDAPEGY